MNAEALFKLAKDSINSYFSDEDLVVDAAISKELSKKQGVFVTLHKHGELRGCIGYTEPVFPLWQAIAQAAQAAAFSDPRFPPVRKEELKDIKFEVSVLTVPELIKVKLPEEYLKKIKIGEDGLIIRSSYGSGLLLPQVFTEYKSTPQRALEMTCNKAGLPRDAWKDMGNKIYKFQAEIFSE